jgi:hypothetical protein
MLDANQANDQQLPPKILAVLDILQTFQHNLPASFPALRRDVQAIERPVGISISGPYLMRGQGGDVLIEDLATGEQTTFRFVLPKTWYEDRGW